jgi:succinate dehydrogenase/fumarate reductase flavoprotein subunit
MSTNDNSYDCIVVGSGHAGSCAALSASDSGLKRVLIIDKCPAEWVGGNGYFTAGGHRTVHSGLEDVLPIVRNVDAETAAKVDMSPYTAQDFVEDVMRVSGGRSDPALVDALVAGSRDAIGWLSERVNMPFQLAFHRQAYEVNGRQQFWGGMVLSVEDGGKGLIRAHREALETAGVETWFDTAAVELVYENGRITGLIVNRNGELTRLATPSVVLACGGWEASTDLRKRYLGEHWKRAKVGKFSSANPTHTHVASRFAAHPTTPETGFRLRHVLVPRSRGTSRDATRRAGTQTPLLTAETGS